MIDGRLAEERDGGEADQALLHSLHGRQALVEEIASRRAWRPLFAGGTPEIGRLAASIEERKPAGIGSTGRRGPQVEPYEKYWVLTA